MIWGWFYREAPTPPAGRGRPWPRLVRGLLWALLAIFIISILAFAAGEWLEAHRIVLHFNN